MTEDTKAQTDTAHTGHPTPLTYFKVALILSIITAIEVGIFYIEGLGHSIIPVLIILSGLKFGLVALFYMHLRYDAPLFSWLFFSGLALATSVFIAVLGLFKFFA